MAQGEKRVSVVESGFFRQPVVRSGDAVHRPEAPPRRNPFPAAESLVAPLRVQSLRGKAARTIYGDSNR